MDSEADISLFDKLAASTAGHNDSMSVFNADVISLVRTSDGSKKDDGTVYKEVLVVFDDESIAKWTVQFDGEDVMSSKSELYHYPEKGVKSSAAKLVQRLNKIPENELYFKTVDDPGLLKLYEAMIRGTKQVKIPDNDLV